MKNDKEADFHVPFHVHLLFYNLFQRALLCTRREGEPTQKAKSFAFTYRREKTVFIANPLTKLQTEQAELF